MVSKIKVDEIESSQSGGSIAYNSSMKFKQYTTTQIDALTGMAEGEMVYDTTVSDVKIYDGNNWAKITSTAFITGTGGTTTTHQVGAITYKVHTFTSGGTFQVTEGTGTISFFCYCWRWWWRY